MISFYTAPGIPHIKGHRHRKLNSFSNKQQEILEAVMAYFSISKNDLQERSKKTQTVYHRAVFAYLLYNLGEITLVDAATFLNCHHCSIVYYRITVESQLTSKFENDYKIDIPALISIINSSKTD